MTSGAAAGSAGALFSTGDRERDLERDLDGEEERVRERKRFGALALELSFSLKRRARV